MIFYSPPTKQERQQQWRKQIQQKINNMDYETLKLLRSSEPRDLETNQNLNSNEQKQTNRYLHTILQTTVLIKQGLQQQALEPLQLIQKQIQQDIKKGKKVTQSIFVMIFHNLASIHQKMNNKNKSLDKIRTILHFLNNHRLAKLQQAGDFQSRLMHLNLTVNIAKYYISFLYFSIELKMYEAATIPINRILQYFKKFHGQYKKTFNTLELININISQFLLFALGQFEKLLDNHNIQEITQFVKKSLFKTQEPPNKWEGFHAKFNKMNLENLLTILPVQIQVDKKKQEGFVQKNYRAKAYQNGLLQFPIALFLIGRCIYQSMDVKFKNQQQVDQKIMAYDKAKKYILWSLHYICQFCPYFSKLHQQVFEYYDKNFMSSQDANQKPKINQNSKNLLQSPKLTKSAWSQIRWAVKCRETHQINYQKYPRQQRRQINFLITEKKRQAILQQTKKEFQKKKLKQIQQKNGQNDSKSHRRSNRQSSQQIFNKFQNINENRSIKTEKHIDIPKHKQIKGEKVESVSNLSEHKQKNKGPVSVKKRKKSNKKLASSHSQKKSLNKQKSEKSTRKPKQKNKLDPNQQYYHLDSGKQMGILKRQRIAKNQRKQKKQLINNYFSLQKKIKEGKKMLNKKKKQLYKSLKKL